MRGDREIPVVLSRLRRCWPGRLSLLHSGFCVLTSVSAIHTSRSCRWTEVRSQKSKSERRNQNAELRHAWRPRNPGRSVAPSALLAWTALTSAFWFLRSDFRFCNSHVPLVPMDRSTKSEIEVRTQKPECRIETCVATEKSRSFCRAFGAAGLDGSHFCILVSAF